MNGVGAQARVEERGKEVGCDPPIHSFARHRHIYSGQLHRLPNSPLPPSSERTKSTEITQPSTEPTLLPSHRNRHNHPHTHHHIPSPHLPYTPTPRLPPIPILAPSKWRHNDTERAKKHGRETESGKNAGLTKPRLSVNGQQQGRGNADPHWGRVISGTMQCSGVEWSGVE
ncbi:Mitochondrion biogenesis protein (Mdm31) [Echinococcus multilocularis]|uniref:Mitochondrion biogenesis protein (Mdm31) n=1 Tax=Echinococcus multilocularis TaxID=6211 RepID=A0A0S4MQ89_ECHMU|nr:Mitochondrion biogenesis protein (Mdm31) [Echinococcus multilocularis]